MKVMTGIRLKSDRVVVTCIQAISPLEGDHSISQILLLFNLPVSQAKWRV
jgi:hypothetical protein